MKRYLTRKNIGMFCIVFLCLAVLVTSVFTVIYMRSTEKERIDYTELLSADADAAFSHVSQPVSGTISSCNSIFNATWYEHFSNIAEIYADDFNPLKQIEVGDEMTRLVMNQPMISDILVVMPQRGYVVSRYGWRSLESYVQVYKTVNIDSSQGYTVMPEITVRDPEYGIITLADSNNRKYKNAIVILLSKKTFANEVEKALGANAKWAELTIGDQLLVEADPSLRGESDIVLTRSSNSSRMTLTVGYQSFENAVGRSSRMTYFMLLGAAYLASGLLAVFITAIFMRPMNQMVRNLGGKEQDMENPYRFIYEYVDRFSRNQEQLNEENIELLNSRKRLLSMLRNEIVINVLTSGTTNFEDDYIKSSFPWLSEKGHFLLAACQSTFGGPKAESLIADELCAECENSGFAHIGQEMWMILRFENEEKLRLGREELREKMKKMPNIISGAFEDPAEAHGIYLELREALKELGEQWLHLPILTQSRLVSLARTNKREELCQMIGELHNLDSVFWLLSRLSWESGHDNLPMAEQFRTLQDTATREELVKLLQDYAVSLCAHISARKPAAPNDNSDEILRYIDENFRDSMLSVNQLADQFGIHRTLISKMVKSATGDTFSDYLTNLRMAEAEKLLREGVRPITAVGEKVGIPNYSTFKRSFQKAFGESPKEWLEKQ